MALADRERIEEMVAGANMVFITAGMGGGTGTGAAPVIARAVRELGILTVGVVTKPFAFEGDKRMRIAERGILELQQYVHTLIVIPNQNLFRVANDRTTFAQAFAMADEVLHSGVRGVTDLIVMPGLINLDFADIKAVISEMGKAMMGTGESEGENRAQKAAEMAKEDCARAMDLAHKLSFQLRASEERGRELEAEAAHFRDRATRAEAWLLRIHNEVEQTFFSKQIGRAHV